MPDRPRWWPFPIPIPGGTPGDRIWRDPEGNPVDLPGLFDRLRNPQPPPPPPPSVEPPAAEPPAPPPPAPEPEGPPDPYPLEQLPRPEHFGPPILPQPTRYGRYELRRDDSLEEEARRYNREGYDLEEFCGDFNLDPIDECPQFAPLFKRGRSPAFPSLPGGLGRAARALRRRLGRMRPGAANRESRALPKLPAPPGRSPTRRVVEPSSQAMGAPKVPGVRFPKPKPSTRPSTRPSRWPFRRRARPVFPRPRRPRRIGPETTPSPRRPVGPVVRPLPPDWRSPAPVIRVPPPVRLPTPRPPPVVIPRPPPVTVPPVPPREPPVRPSPLPAPQPLPRVEPFPRVPLPGPPPSRPATSPRPARRARPARAPRRSPNPRPQRRTSPLWRGLPLPLPLGRPGTRTNPLRLPFASPLGNPQPLSPPMPEPIPEVVPTPSLPTPLTPLNTSALPFAPPSLQANPDACAQQAKERRERRRRQCKGTRRVFVKAHYKTVCQF